MSTTTIVGPPEADDTQRSIFEMVWQFLNAPVEPTWMHTLFQGLVAAVLGAGVALLVLVVTVRTQNAGIRKQIAVQRESLQAQIDAQGRSIAEQLSVQRYENTRNRELAVIGRMLAILNDWSDEHAKGSMSADQSHDYFKARLSELVIGLEELRINGGPSVDPTIDSFISFSFHMREAMKEAAYRVADPREYELPALTSFYIERFLVTHLIRYARMNHGERVQMNDFLQTALSDFSPHDIASWEKKYMKEIMRSHRR